MTCPNLLSSVTNPLIYSKEDSICGVTIIPYHLAPLKELVEFTISPELISYTILSPLCVHHQSLSFKVLVEVKLTETLSYRSYNLDSTLLHYQTSFTKKIILALPSTIDHCNTSSLFLTHQLSIIPMIHTVYSKVLDCHSIYKSTLFSLHIKRHYGPA